tara:strand:- start:1 stop:189 length:189 start_codon:yes stop_codon:yes gene_type:complete
MTIITLITIIMQDKKIGREQKWTTIRVCPLGCGGSPPAFISPGFDYFNFYIVGLKTYLGPFK